MNDILEKYGIPGIAIAGLAWFVLYLMKEHRREREEQNKVIERLFDKTNTTSIEGTKAITELSTIIKGMKKG